MFSIPTLLIAIPALPLAAAVFTALFGPRVLHRQSHWPTLAAIGLSCAASILLVFEVQRGIDQCGQQGTVEGQVGYEQQFSLWTWADVPDAYQQPGRSVSEGNRPSGTPVATFRDFRVEVTLRADPLTAIMLATVTFVAAWVAVYSVGYMHGDRGYWRFFTYISLFVFSMTMLVSVSNFVLLYVFWEAVGVCSYLLIGFWYQKPEAAAAGKKAFLVNRVGDFGLALALFLIWITYGTLDFHDTLVDGNLHTAGVLGQHMLGHPELYVGGGVGLAIGLLLMLGACGKSAQFPLHVWLPDAMEGPTPVSALIHAATMVTAGVYLVARCTPLFHASPEAQYVVAAVAGFSALLAALIALTQTDLKRILAYSTISQLGFMFLGLGAASLLGITAGIFHFFTHAFFKALLFLGAGSVMHAMGNVIDIRRFGGLRRILPKTRWTFLIGCLALAGICPLSGFWSKDVILVALYERAVAGEARWLFHLLLYGAMATVLLTALYTFRAYFLTFHGEQRVPAAAADHARESPPSMTVPLVVLAVCAAGAGAYFEWTHDFSEFLHEAPSVAYLIESAGETLATGTTHAEELAAESDEMAREFRQHLMVGGASAAAALAGILLAAMLYLGRRERLVAALADVMGPLYRLSHGKFFFDEIYHGLIVLPIRGLAALCAWIDEAMIDGLVNLCGRVPKLIGAALRPTQPGLIQFYALAMALGLLVLMGVLAL